MRGITVDAADSAINSLLYTAGIAAERLQLRESTLRCWAREGKVPCRRLGRALRFSEEDL